MGYRDIPSIDALGEAGDIDAPIGSRAWAIAVRGDLSICLSDEASNRGRIKHLTNLLQESRGYERLSDARGKSFTSWRSFCVAPAPWGLKYDPDLLDAIIDEHNQPIALRVEQAAQMTNGVATPHGTNRYNAIEYSGNTLDDRAESVGISKATQWRLDYLARNAPELHEAVKRGEIGVRTAYEQARGIKKIEVRPDPEHIAELVIEHFTHEQIVELIERLAPFIPIEAE